MNVSITSMLLLMPATAVLAMPVVAPRALLVSAAVGSGCERPPATLVKDLDRRADAYLEMGNRTAAAAELQRAAELYPACAAADKLRIDMVMGALNALRERGASGPASACHHPEVQAALLIGRVQSELRLLPDTKRLVAARSSLTQRLAKLPEPARAAATLLDRDTPPVSAEASTDAYRSAVATFGECQALREALVRHTFALLPRELPPAPSCDPAVERARELLRGAMKTLEETGGEVASATPEYALLGQRLALLGEVGPTLARLQTRAMAAREADRAAEAWAEVARGLPTCAVYLGMKGDAALAAVTAWQREDSPALSVPRRFELADGFLAEMLAAIEADRGPEAPTLAVHQALTKARAGLVRPPPTKAKPRVRSSPPPRPPGLTPIKKPSASKRPGRRLSSLQTAGITSFSLGGAGMGMLIGGVVMGLGANQDLRALRLADPTLDADALRASSAFKHGETSSKLVTAGLSLGVVGLATGIVLLSVDTAQRRRSERRVRPTADGLAISF